LEHSLKVTFELLRIKCDGDAKDNLESKLIYSSDDTWFTSLDSGTTHRFKRLNDVDT